MRATLLCLLCLYSQPLRAQIVSTSIKSGSGTTVISGTGATTIRPQQWILTLGDSKTATSTMPAMGQWQGPLIASLAAQTKSAWTYSNRGVGSQTVATYLALLQAQGFPATTVWSATNPPFAVLINLGVNESILGMVPTQLQWTTDYLALIDLVRSSWPTAPIYIMQWWAAGHNADADTMDAWIPAIVAARPNCFLGPDERIWSKGADNGATMTYDGTHQSVAGHLFEAVTWKALLLP